jgi:hypothetical protein
MSKRLYPHRRVKYWYAYDIDDICMMFTDLGLHPQTVRKWIKNDLMTIDSGKPALVYGNDLIVFLRTRNTENKCTTEFDELFCMGCRDARPVFQKKIIVKQKKQFLMVKGLCRECKTPMYQNYKLNELPRLRKNFVLVEVLELYDRAIATDKTHIATQKQSPINESAQGSFL